MPNYLGFLLVHTIIYYYLQVFLRLYAILFLCVLYQFMKSLVTFHFFSPLQEWDCASNNTFFTAEWIKTLYILSGASIPSKYRPSLSTILVASTRASRAFLGSASACSTGHVW